MISGAHLFSIWLTVMSLIGWTVIVCGVVRLVNAFRYARPARRHIECRLHIAELEAELGMLDDSPFSGGLQNRDFMYSYEFPAIQSGKRYPPAYRVAITKLVEYERAREQQLVAKA